MPGQVWHAPSTHEAHCSRWQRHRRSCIGLPPQSSSRGAPVREGLAPRRTHAYGRRGYRGRPPPSRYRLPRAQRGDVPEPRAPLRRTWRGDAGVGHVIQRPRPRHRLRVQQPRPRRLLLPAGQPPQPRALRAARRDRPAGRGPRVPLGDRPDRRRPHRLDRPARGLRVRGRRAGAGGRPQARPVARRRPHATDALSPAPADATTPPARGGTAASDRVGPGGFEPP